MVKLREWMAKNAWAAWALLGVLAIVLVYVQFLRKSNDPYDPDRMTQMVTIHFKDTGDDIQMPRGRMEQELRLRGTTLSPDDGIANPKTGAHTGFPKSEWDETVSRLNTERSKVLSSSSKSTAPVPAPDRGTTPKPPNAPPTK